MPYQPTVYDIAFVALCDELAMSELQFDAEFVADLLNWSLHPFSWPDCSGICWN